MAFCNGRIDKTYDLQLTRIQAIGSARKFGHENASRAHVAMGALNESRSALQWMRIESFDFSGVLQWTHR